MAGSHVHAIVTAFVPNTSMHKETQANKEIGRREKPPAVMRP